MTWRQGALILGTYVALAAVLTAVALALGSDPPTRAAAPRPAAETRATLEIPPSSSPGRAPAASRRIDARGENRPGRSGPAGPDAPASRPDAPTSVPRRSGATVRRGGAAGPSIPAAGADGRRTAPSPTRPVPAPGPAPAPGPPPVVLPPAVSDPVSVPVTAPAPGGATTTLRSVQGVGRTGSTQSVVLDFDVDGLDGATRSVDVPLTLTPPPGAVALRIDVDLSPTDTAGEDARVEVAPVAVAPVAPTVEGHADGTHSVVVALPLNGVLAPVAGGAADFSAPSTTSEVPVLTGVPAARPQD